MKLTEHQIPGGTELIFEATNENEHDLLINFARPNEQLLAKTEENCSYTHPYLIVRKDQS